MSEHIHAPKGETPASDQANGVPREKAEMFDLPAFCPLLPLAVQKKGGAA